MNNTIDDIKQLPDLFKRKEELEDQIKKLDEQKVALNEEMEAEKTKAEETLGTFDATIEAYKKASMEWWKQFYKENSVEIVQTSIISLITKQTKDQQELDESQKLVSDEFTRNINEAQKAFEDNKILQQEFAQSAGTIAQKAMCYDVCLFIDRSNFTIKKFNDNRDWGLHLCPNGISISIFKYLFMLTNPFGYMDLKKAVASLPSLYGKLLDSNKRLQGIIRQNYIKDVNNPVGELKRRLSSAKDTIARKSKELETTKQQVLDLQKLMALVGGGLESFMQQWFGHQSFLSEQKKRYVVDMRDSLSKLSDYSSMKLVYDELIENVFDFKDADSYIKDAREQIKESVGTAINTIEIKRKDVDSKINEILEILNSTHRKIKELRADYKNALIEKAKQDPASTFFYQADGWINEKDEEGNNLAIERIKIKASEREELDYLPIYEYLVEGEDAKLSSTEWHEAVMKGIYAINLIVKPRREDLKVGANNIDAYLWAASNLLTSIMLSLPFRKVHFTFIDFKTHGIYTKLFKDINSSRSQYSVILTDNQLKEIPEKYVERTQSSDKRYEIIVWTDCIDENFKRVKDVLSPILENGAKHGYYLIAVPMEKERNPKLIEEFEFFKKNYNFREIYAPAEDFESGRGDFVKKLKEYVQDETAMSKATSVYQTSMSDGSLFRSTPENINKKGLKVPIGVDELGNEVFWELKAESANIHTMVIGGSGSGKSYLLHNMLLNSMLKYNSQSLELYVMDFKVGAPEFNQYEGMPHVSHLLLNNADRRMVYEILRRLKKDMTRRGDLITNAGYNNISDYNSNIASSDMRLPYIVLVVDECQKLFEAAPLEQNLQDEINNIVQDIAHEGRSQGVSFFFATQTFSGMRMPQDVKKLIGNKYLMHVATDEDAEELFKGGSNQNGLLTQGFAYHEASRTTVHIYDYKPYFGDALKSIRDNNYQFKKNEPFVFRGTDMHILPYIQETGKAYPIAYLGVSVSVEREKIGVGFNMANGSNLLITGINSELQAERLFYNAMISLVNQKYVNGKIHISVFENLGFDDDNYDQRKDVLTLVEKNNTIQFLRTDNQKVDEIIRLSEIVEKDDTDPSQVYILFILAEERMRQLLMRDIPEKEINIVGALSKKEQLLANFSDSNRRRKKETVQDKLVEILKDGGGKHVHVVMQVNHPDNILSMPEDVRRQDIGQWFRYFALLKSPLSAQDKLPLPGDKISLNRLSEKSDMLRAIFLDVNKIGSQLFIPYKMPNSNETIIRNQ